MCKDVEEIPYKHMQDKKKNRPKGKRKKESIWTTEKNLLKTKLSNKEIILLMKDGMQDEQKC